jgi:hypothetical protein
MLPNNTSLPATGEDTIWRITSQKTEGVVTGVVTTTQGVVENDPTCGNYNTVGGRKSRIIRGDRYGKYRFLGVS